MKIEEDQFVPADMILLYSSGPKGTCYVETKSLDGETNLKLKQTQKELQTVLKKEADFFSIRGEMECERPNAAIYNFEGIVKLND